MATGRTAGDELRDPSLDAGFDVGPFDVGGFEELAGGVGNAVGSGGTGGVAVEAGRGAPAVLTALEGGPLGGGGGVAAVGVASGFFLSIHLFFSES